MEKEPKFNKKENKLTNDEREKIRTWFDKPIDVPEHIVRLFKEIKKKYEDVNLSHEEWSKLNEDHRKRMTGDSDDDLFFQLAVYRDAHDSAGEIVALRKLRTCYCGSGKKYIQCHEE